MRFMLLAVVIELSSSLVFCSAEGCLHRWDIPAPLVEDYRRASLVIVGQISKPRAALAVDGPAAGQVVDIDIENAIKPHSIVTATRKLTVPGGGNAANNGQWLIFCSIENGRVVPFRGVAVDQNGKLLQYFTGAVARKDRPVAERLAYCFPFLDNENTDASSDAFLEFRNASVKAQREMARKLDPKLLVAALTNTKMPRYRLGLYASLLGHCGTAPEHGNLLRRLIENTDRHQGSGLDDMMVAYVLIQPQEGWRYLEHGVIGDTAGNFHPRFCAIRAMRVLWREYSEIVPKNKLVGAMLAAAEFPDVADFAIEDLRKWKRWETTEQVLAVVGRKTHNVGVIQRAGLRFALQSPVPAAAAFVAAQRARDAELVADMEEWLKFEREMADGK